MTEFWKDVKKNSNSNVSLATNVDGSVGNTEIAEMWKCHYKSLLNSVQNKEFKKSVLLDINQQHESSITIFMWEEGINTKPQIYYNNNNAGTPQASKRKKKAIQIEKWKTHTQNK